MAKITKETRSVVVLTMDEWSAIRALIVEIGKEPLGSRGFEEYKAAGDVVAAVAEAKRQAGLC